MIFYMHSSHQLILNWLFFVNHNNYFHIQTINISITPTKLRTQPKLKLSASEIISSLPKTHKQTHPLHTKSQSCTNDTLSHYQSRKHLHHVPTHVQPCWPFPGMVVLCLGSKSVRVSLLPLLLCVSVCFVFLDRNTTRWLHKV